MSLFSKQFKNKIRQTHLSTEEHKGIYSRLHKEMRAYPIVNILSTKQQSVIGSRMHKIFNKRTLRKTMPLTLIAGLLMGAGVSYAAEGSLPGDSLYPIKIHVNEGVRSSLARTDSEKAQIEAELATRRLEETELLNQEGRLSTSTKDSLKASFNEHQGRVTEHLRSLSKEHKEDADKIQSEVRAQFSKHRNGMEALGEHEDGNEDGGDNESNHHNGERQQNPTTTNTLPRSRPNEDGGGDKHEDRQSIEQHSNLQDRSGEHSSNQVLKSERKKDGERGDNSIREGEGDNQDRRTTITIPSIVIPLSSGVNQ